MSVYRYKNSKFWWMDFIFDGVRVRESTKTRAKKLAQEIERKRREELESGRMGLKKRDRPRLFSLTAEEYLAIKKPVLSDRGLIIERSNLKHLLLAFGGKLLSDIDAADISHYQRDRLQAGAAPKTINLEIGTLRAILNEKEAAKLLGFTVKTLQTWRCRERGPRYFKGEGGGTRGTVRYDLADLEAWKSAGLHTPSARASAERVYGDI
jgi:hypothetical protein